MNPFQHKSTPVCATPHTKTARTKHGRSLSRIHGMTVGDVRQCFTQMRKTPDLTSNTTLWCGITAGNFALRYQVDIFFTFTLEELYGGWVLLDDTIVGVAVLYQ